MSERISDSSFEPHQDPHERAIYGERDLPFVDGKLLRPFIQYDAWASDGDVGLVEADDDGDAICMGGVLEHQRSDTTVRLLVDPGAPLADLDRVLTKIRTWIRTNPELIAEADPPSLAHASY